MPTRRDLRVDFAGYLARLLNTGEVQAYAIYLRIVAMLAKPGYREQLLGYHLGYRSPGSGLNEMEAAEEAATKYFAAVFQRALHLGGGRHLHKSHELFLAMCRRGKTPEWALAELARMPNSAPAGDDATPLDFASVAARLANLNTQLATREQGAISRGNPAASTRATHGPLFLKFASFSAEVPEELPVEGAIRCAPLKLNVLTNGPQFNAFCSLVIKLIDSADEPWRSLLSVGLWPPHWLGAVNVNSVKQLSAFLSAARKLAGQTGDSYLTLRIWQSVWEERQVPGFKTAEELWNSELGRAVRVAELPEPAPEELDEEPEDVEMLPPDQFHKMIDSAAAEGVFDDFDTWVLKGLISGMKIAELNRTLAVRKRFGANGISREYIHDLRNRLRRWIRHRWHDGDAD